FIHDVYHEQEILKAGIVPADQVLNNAQFRREMMGVNVPGDVYSHVSGIDIVRAANADGSGSYYVLEDNLRVPSGVSYMLENRKMMMRLFPELFSMHRVAPVAHYPDLLLDVYRRGNITLANAIGTGIADDKSIYPYVPRMIEFYLGEKPVLNNVPTWLCRDADDLGHVLEHLADLVVKEVHGAGGYGMLVG